jgi:archaellum component FlaF (FlaF/FlaG flagellin family)
MGTFYNIPIETVSLSIIDVEFPATNATRFNVTVLNPSYSPRDVVITEIRFTVEDNATFYGVMKTEPKLPFTLKRGFSQTFICTSYWGGFAGKIITVHVMVENASGPNYAYQTPTVKMTVNPVFNPRVRRAVEHFNVTVKNSEESVINLTITDIVVNGITVEPEKITPSLPQVLPPNRSVTFFCNWDWRAIGKENVTVIVRTEERYEGVGTVLEPGIAYLDVEKVLFDEADTNHFTVVIRNLNESTVEANLAGIEIIFEDGKVIKINETIPPLPHLEKVLFIKPGNFTKIKCTWNWTLYRNKPINVTAYTKQGFQVTSESVTTPPEVFVRILEANFSLTDTSHFNLTIKNLETSLEDVNVNKIEVIVDGKSEVVMEDTVPLEIGSAKSFNLTWNWKGFANKNVTITIYTEEGFNDSYTLRLPSVKLEILVESVSFGKFFGEIDYFNITIRNDELSLFNVTIWEITIETPEGIFSVIDAIPALSPNGTELAIGTNKTFSCISEWKWSNYVYQEIVFYVTTREGFKVSAVVTVKPPS